MSANIEHLRAVGRAATEGPWEVKAEDADAFTGESDLYVSTPTSEVLAGIYEDADAIFIATARNEWDALLDEVGALRAKVARVEEINLRNAASAGAEALRADRADAKVARVEALATAKEDDTAQANATPDPLTGRHSTMRAFVLTTELRAALADESAQDALSRPGTTAVASGATGDTQGREIGAQDEGGK